MQTKILMLFVIKGVGHFTSNFTLFILRKTGTEPYKETVYLACYGITVIATAFLVWSILNEYYNNASQLTETLVDPVLLPVQNL